MHAQGGSQGLGRSPGEVVPYRIVPSMAECGITEPVAGTERAHTLLA